ncbi:adeC/adeK/oprM family multidrug efflux complex outer membrane factor [Arenicella chitinivorans]|uniref:AdeC/adeK/oprM family multidrug efflux complex outer membrane factor n=1 Tax=Arenicella chitinivorans TaxID=1329800 RepID=A0A918VJQ5_9GAMM|nr:TolC family protein [Arenicella chitinivorans]GHA04551.1 adeC/adeK/oprM family multidrug efflux complex outer membrane factor [Arenicella chitinivorans]
MRNRTNLTSPVSNLPQPSTLTPLRVAGIAAMLLLGGCATNLDKLPSEPKVEVPQAWQTTQAQKQTPAATAEESQALEPTITEESVQSGWLSQFDDPELETYVQTALQNNPDLWSSAAQLKSAIEQVTVTGASLWPNVQAGVQSTRRDTETDGITTEVRTVSGTLDIAWEADVWGKLTQRKKATALSAQAQAELYNAAELSLVANVTRAWFNLMTNKLQLDLAEQRLESFQNTAKLIEENYERGLRSALDVYLSRTDVQRQIADLSDSKFNYISSLRAFKTLLGEYPTLSMSFDAKLPALTDPIPAGLPAELLTRRPDIKASQFQYESQVANAKAANRDRYPSINFTGSIGDSRDSFNQLFENNNLVTTLVAGIAQPVFQAGALKSREEQAYYQAEQAYANLVKTTLNAFEEVENSLSRESILRRQHTAIKEAVRLAQGGLDLALDRYQTGIENYTTVLQSQRSLFDSMRTEINIRNALLQNRIGIHLALGGDFATEESRSENQLLPGPIAAQTTSDLVEEPESASKTE